MDEAKRNKNTTGELGPICNTCGGFGFTLNISSGGSSGCHDCNQTGIASPTTLELQKQIQELKSKLN